MGLEGLDPATGMLSGGFARLFSYAWVLIPLVIIFSLIGIVWWIKKIKNKKAQWTHTLKIRRVLPDKRLTDPVFINMRRFPLVKKAEVFELEKPLLGGYLINELDEYSGDNEFSIILDRNNRIYTNKGEFFCPDKHSVNVSAKHSEIDIARANLRAKYQDINKINKRIEWSTIAKYAFMIMLIICVTIMGIIGLQKWGEAQTYKAQEAEAMANVMTKMAEAMETMEATVNTQKLEILPLMKEIYKTENLANLINFKFPEELNNESV